MNLSNFFIRFGYYIGLLHGLFNFSYNSDLSEFQVSRKLKYYNIFFVLFCNILSVSLLFLQDPSLSFKNLVIQITGPINILSLNAVLSNIYLISWKKNKKIVDMSNLALKLNKLSTFQCFEFTLKSFLTTFAIDTFSIILNIVIIINYKKIFFDLPLNFIIFLNVMQSLKVIGRYVNNIFVFIVGFLEHLMKNLELKIKNDLKRNEVFFRGNIKCSSYQFKENCYKMSQTIEQSALQYQKVIELAVFVNSLFSIHNLFEIIRILTDVLILVRILFNVQNCLFCTENYSFRDIFQF